MDKYPLHKPWVILENKQKENQDSQFIIDKLQKRNTQLESTIQRLENQINKLKNKNISGQESKGKLLETNQRLRDEIRDLRSVAQVVEAENKDLKKQVNRKERRFSPTEERKKLARDYNVHRIQKRVENEDNGLIKVPSSLPPEVMDQVNLEQAIAISKQGYKENNPGEEEVNPDALSYEELMELEEKMGKVNKGLKQQEIFKINQRLYESSGYEESKNCVICQEDYRSAEIVTELHSKHIFHFDCIKKYFQTEKICPICRKPHE